MKLQAGMEPYLLSVFASSTIHEWPIEFLCLANDGDNLFGTC
jgi:hypothetical protein